MLRKLAVSAASFAAIAGIIFLAIASIGRPISTDLSAIGQGKPALVLVFENYSPTGGDAFDRLSEIRDDYESRIDFLIADLGVPQGRAFADRHRLANGQALFVRADGTHLRAMSIPADEQALRTLLDGKLAELN
ncbi:MAG: hypothetical protein AAGE01_22425 [Pseudomonadota bacterium]